MRKRPCLSFDHLNDLTINELIGLLDGLGVDTRELKRTSASTNEAQLRQSLYKLLEGHLN